jgi:hypothetical protein
MRGTHWEFLWAAFIVQRYGVGYASLSAACLSATIQLVKSNLQF